MLKLVFLDRDGTINIDHGYVVKPENVDLIDGAAEAIALLKKAGYRVVVVSNQSAIGRGMASHEDVEATNSELKRKLELENPEAIIDLILYAADHPDQPSDRRKPGIGMLRDASMYFDIDLEASWVIGDKFIDLEFGQNAGLPKEQCLLVLSGQDRASSCPSWVLHFENLLLAAKHVVSISDDA